MKEEMNMKTKDAARALMSKLAGTGLNNAEAINALLVALIVSCHNVGLDKTSLMEAMVENWDIVANAKPQTH